jgi:hypothetical protein
MTSKSTKEEMSKMLLMMGSEERNESKRLRQAAFDEDQIQRRAFFEQTEALIEDGKMPVLQAFCVSVKNLSLHCVKRGKMMKVSVQRVSVAYGREASAHAETMSKIEHAGLQSFFPKTMAVDTTGWNLKEEDHEVWMDKNEQLESALWTDADKLHVKAVEYSAELVTKVKAELVKNESCVDFVDGLDNAEMRLLRETARAITCFQKMANVHNFALSHFEAV